MAFDEGGAATLPVIRGYRQEHLQAATAWLRLQSCSMNSAGKLHAALPEQASYRPPLSRPPQEHLLIPRRLHIWTLGSSVHWNQSRPPLALSCTVRGLGEDQSRRHAAGSRCSAGEAHMISIMVADVNEGCVLQGLVMS